MAVPLDPLSSHIYLQRETSRTSQQPRSNFAWLLPLYNIIFPIIWWSWSSNVSFYEEKNFMALFHGWGSTTSRLELLWGGSLFFTIKFPEIAGSYSFFINLWRTNYTNTKIWSKERSIGPYIAKMLFPQRGFWLCYTTAIYKNIWSAYCAFQLCSYNRSVAGLRKI